MGSAHPLLTHAFQNLDIHIQHVILAQFLINQTIIVSQQEPSNIKQCKTSISIVSMIQNHHRRSQSPITNRKIAIQSFKTCSQSWDPSHGTWQLHALGFIGHYHTALLRSFYLSLQEVLVCIPIHTRAISSWNYKFTCMLPQPIHRLHFTCRILFNELPNIPCKSHKRSFICHLSWSRRTRNSLNPFRVYRYSFI